MMLVSAFAGMQTIRDAYRHAIEERYRFFSYGDAMLLTRDNAEYTRNTPGSPTRRPVDSMRGGLEIRCASAWTPLDPALGPTSRPSPQPSARSTFYPRRDCFPVAQEFCMT